MLLAFLRVILVVVVYSFLISTHTPFFLLFISIGRNVLEELVVRADIALNQKRVIHDVTFDGPVDDVDEDFEKEYMALSAQVVRTYMSLFCWRYLLFLVVIVVLTFQTFFIGPLPTGQEDS